MRPQLRGSDTVIVALKCTDPRVKKMRGSDTITAAAKVRARFLLFRYSAVLLSNRKQDKKPQDPNTSYLGRLKMDKDIYRYCDGVAEWVEPRRTRGPKDRGSNPVRSTNKKQV